MRWRWTFGILVLWLLSAISTYAQKNSAIQTSPILRIDPPDWWVGMKEQKLQLCVYGKHISNLYVSSSYEGFRIEKVSKVENPNYLFVDVVIDPSAKPGRVELKFTDAERKYTHSFILHQKDTSAGRIKGFDASDLVYLIMPDRFANGDRKNDRVDNMNEQAVNRDSMFYRHGGDLKGVTEHIDYIKELGATAIWLTPVQENNQPKASYHGYAFTDHYRVDPRLGDNEGFKNYTEAVHANGMKVIMDMVYNHVGTEHWFIRDLPSRDWIHQFDTFTKTNYRATALVDPYASEFDKNLMSNGWFVKQMPDLNQQNPYLANYLIQNAIWWIETMGIDGFRIDTYTYSDVTFMSDLMRRVQVEYPRFHAVGELWDHNVAIEAYFQQHPKLNGVPDSYLPGLTDFQLYHAINEALTKPMGWTEGLSRIYYTLMQDYLYSKPEAHLTFLDNHDLSRFYSVVGEDLRKYKMGIAFLMTMRGIPSLYYGTEVLMKNYADPDGKVRDDYHGGWAGDRKNTFMRKTRTDKENEAFDYVKKLANYRKENDVLHTGKLTQFVPENNVYVYFRSNERKTVMVVMHYGDKPNIIHLSRFAEKIKPFTAYKDVLTDKVAPLTPDLTLEPYEVRVLEFSK